MAYIGNNLDSDIQVNKYEYTATAGQTTFACTYDRAVDVYINGVKLAGSDFTATNGTAIVLTSGANDGDIVDINAYFDVTYANADAILPDQTGNTGKFLTSDGTTSSWGAVDLNSRVAKTGDTMTGTLKVLESKTSPSLILQRPANTSNQGDFVQGIRFANAVDDWYADVFAEQSTIYPDALGLAFRTQNGTGGRDVRMRIDSAGRVTMPYQPAFCGIKTTSVVAGTGTYTNWDTVQLNVGGHFNAVTGIFTAPVAGNYCFSHSCINSGTGYVNVFIYKNGSIVIGSGARPSSSLYNQATKTIIIPLAANDTVHLTDNLGGTSGTHSDSNGWTQFCGHLIG